MKNNKFTATSKLLKLFFRRDIFLLSLWVLLPVVLVFIVAVTFKAMAIDGFQNVMNEFDKDPLISALLGPVISFDLAGAIVWRGVSQISLTLGIGSMLTVIRHTRTDEETGRSELIRAYAVGSCSSLTAALILVFIGNVVSGVLIAFSIMALGGAAGGSFVFGATMSVVGIFFSGIGALGAQLRENGGTARGIGFSALGLGIVLAILNNFGGGDTFLKWLTPMAWQRLTQPFAENYVWNLLYGAVFSSVPIIIAYILTTRRDLGAGILLPKPGEAEASKWFSSPLALAWRLHKRSFMGWIAGMVLYICVFAAISPGLSSSGGMSDWLSNLGGTSWSDEVGLGYVFISISIYLVSLFVAVYGISSILKIKKEEKEGRLEILADKRVSRIRLMCSHLIIAFACSSVLLLIMGIAGGIVYGLAANNLSREFWNVFYMSVSKISPVWTLIGFTALLYGFNPKLTSLSWIVWLSFSMLELAWEAQAVSWSMMRFSPFSYVHYTINIMNLPLYPLLLMTGISVLQTVIGLYGFMNRDIITKS